MLTIRLTKKLQNRLKLKPESEPGISTTRLGDWYANVVYVGPKPYVLAVSERTLLPVVFPLKGATEFHEVLAVHVGEVLHALDIEEALVRQEVESMKQGTIGKTANRSVLGSLNDFAFLMSAWWEHEQSLLGMSVRLAKVPCAPLKEGFPDRAARESLQRAGVGNEKVPILSGPTLDLFRGIFSCGAQGGTCGRPSSGPQWRESVRQVVQGMNWAPSREWSTGSAAEPPQEPLTP